MGHGQDATREFAAKLSDPQRWVIKTGVPIFKAHERTDPATGQLIKVDLPKLYRIASNMQKLERQGGVPIRCTLGHTEPNKPEPEQPPVGGYYKNARVQPFGPKGEPAVVVDEWLDPQYAPVRKNFPYRSAEYYDDAEQITGVALLTRDPYLDLGVVAYERGDSLVCYTADSPPDRRMNYHRNGRKPVLYHLVLGEVPTNYGSWSGAAQGAVQGGITGARLGATRGPYGAAIGGTAGALAGGYHGYHEPEEEGRQLNNAQYSAPWPGPPHKRANIGHQHPSGGAIYANNGQSPAPYGVSGGLSMMPQTQGPMGAIAEGMGNMTGNSRYAQQGGYGRGQQGRYAEAPPMGPPPGGPGDMGGGPPGGGDPLQQLQMLLMGAVEILGQLTGGGAGGGPPPGPPQEPFPPEGGEEYARYAAQQRYAQQGQRRPAQRPAGYGRQPGRYADPQAPVPYTNPQPPPPQRTISGKPVGESLALSQLNYQLQQQGQVIKMLAYERDAADTAECIANIQRLADQGFPVSEYEVGELKAKPRDQRDSYISHIVTHYAKVPTEQLPLVLGDPTPAGPDPNANRPASKEEMEAALKMASANPTDPLAYNRALEQVRYGRGQQGTQYGVNRIAGYPQQPQPIDPNQQGEWTPGQMAPGFAPANPYGEQPSMNGQY